MGTNAASGMEEANPLLPILEEANPLIPILAEAWRSNPLRGTFDRWAGMQNTSIATRKRIGNKKREVSVRGVEDAIYLTVRIFAEQGEGLEYMLFYKDNGNWWLPIAGEAPEGWNFITLCWHISAKVNEILGREGGAILLSRHMRICKSELVGANKQLAGNAERDIELYEKGWRISEFIDRCADIIRKDSQHGVLSKGLKYLSPDRLDGYERLSSSIIAIAKTPGLADAIAAANVSPYGNTPPIARLRAISKAVASLRYGNRYGAHYGASIREVQKVLEPLGEVVPMCSIFRDLPFAAVGPWCPRIGGRIETVQNERARKRREGLQLGMARDGDLPYAAVRPWRLTLGGNVKTVQAEKAHKRRGSLQLDTACDSIGSGNKTVQNERVPAIKKKLRPVTYFDGRSGDVISALNKSLREPVIKEGDAFRRLKHGEIASHIATYTPYSLPQLVILSSVDAEPRRFSVPGGISLGRENWGAYKDLSLKPKDAHDDLRPGPWASYVLRTAVSRRLVGETWVHSILFLDDEKGRFIVQDGVGTYQADKAKMAEMLRGEEGKNAVLDLIYQRVE
jgi:hypothetical protein